MTSAAFFRLEGALVEASSLSCAAWLAARHHDLTARPLKLAAVALARGLDHAGDSESALTLGYRALAGCSDDRYFVLSRHYVHDVLQKRRKSPGTALIATARAQGFEPVLLSSHPQEIARLFADDLGMTHVIANELERAPDGALTGAWRDLPVTLGPSGAQLRQHAERLGLEVARIAAYSALFSDAVMLASVALPCAVTPDLRLRQIARRCNWPIVERMQ